MAISWITNSTNDNVGGLTVTVTVPSGAQVNDVFLIFLLNWSTQAGATGNWSPVSGWTNVSTIIDNSQLLRQTASYHVIQAGEGPGTSWSWQASQPGPSPLVGCGWLGDLWRGVDLTHIVHTSTNWLDDFASSPTIPSITTTVANVMEVAFGMDDDSSLLVPPSPWIVSQSHPNGSTAVAYQLLASPQTTSRSNWPDSGGGITPSEATVVALTPSTGGGATGPGVVQSASAELVADGGTLSFSTLPSAGHCILVVATSNGSQSTLTSITDNQGNTYTEIGGTFNGPSPSGGGYVSLWATFAIGSPSGTFSVTPHGRDASIAIHEIVGVASVDVDGITATGATTSIASNSITTTADGEIVLVGLALRDGLNPSAPSGWTLQENQTDTNGEPIASYWMVQTTRGPISFSATATSGIDNDWTASIVALHLASGAGPVALANSPTTHSSATASLTVHSSTTGPVIQSTSAEQVPNGGTLTFSLMPAPGNAVVVIGTCFSSPASLASITDNQGNTYTEIGGTFNGPTPSASGYVTMWVAFHVSSSGNTFSVTPIGRSMTLTMHEVTNIGSVDVYNIAATGATNVIASNSISTSVANELVFVGLTLLDGLNPAPSGWTLQESQTNTDGEPAASYWQVKASPGSVSFSATATSGIDNNWACSIVAFNGGASLTVAPQAKGSTTASLRVTGGFAAAATVGGQVTAALTGPLQFAATTRSRGLATGFVFVLGGGGQSQSGFSQESNIVVASVLSAGASQSALSPELNAVVSSPSPPPPPPTPFFYPTTPQYQVLIDGVDYTLFCQTEGMRITQNFGKQGDQMALTLLDEHATDHPNFQITPMQEIVVRDTGLNVVLFGGIISMPEFQWITSNLTLWYLTCRDYTYFADNTIVTGDYVGLTSDQIIKNLMALANCGITTNHVTVGPHIDHVRINYLQLSAAWTKVAKYASIANEWDWFVDEDKDLHFINWTNAAVTPYYFTDDIADRSTFAGHYDVPNLKYDVDAQSLRNRVTVRGANYSQLTTDYFTGNRFTNSWLMTYPLNTTTPKMTLTVNGVSKTIAIFTGGQDPSATDTNTDYVAYQSPGGQWLLHLGTDIFPGTDVGHDVPIVFIYNYQAPVITQANNLKSQQQFAHLGNRGIFEMYVADTSATTLQQAQQIARRELVQYASPQERVTFQSTEDFIGHVRTGQVIRFINSTIVDSKTGKPGINAPFLILANSISSVQVGQRTYNIQAVRTDTLNAANC